MRKATRSQRQLSLAIAQLSEAAMLMYCPPAWAQSMSVPDRNQYFMRCWEQVNHIMRALQAVEAPNIPARQDSASVGTDHGERVPALCSG